MQLEEIRALVTADLQRVDQTIVQRLASDIVLVNQVSQYIIGGGGKRLRPLSVVLAARACGHAGEKLRVESLPADVGSEITLDQVLMVGEGDNVRMGTPTLAGASVKATVVAHGRGEKVRIFKMRRRKHYRKSQGHRQNYTEIQISGISA